MNDITNIQTIIDNACIKQEFIGFIADVSFTDAEIYITVLSLMENMAEKFKRLNNPKEFVKLIKSGIETVFLHKTIELKNYIHYRNINNIDYELDDLKTVSPHSIYTILLKAIEKADKLEDIEFKVNESNKSFNTLNEMLKNKEFNYTTL